jgi:hypothetical protein
MSDPVAESTLAAEQSTVSVAPTAPWEDALDIFYAPTSVFERRKDGKYWIPLLISIVLTMAVFFLSSQVNDAIGEAEFARVMKAQGLTEAQAAQGKAFAEKFKTFGIFFLPIFAVIGAWLTGLIVSFLGRMMGGKLTFAQGTTIGVLASFPEVLGRALVGAQGLFLDTSVITHKYSFATGAARFLSATDPGWKFKLFAIADPFVLWGAVLTGLGAYVIGKVEKEKAAVLSIVVLLVFATLFR